MIDDSGLIESSGKTLPILLASVDLDAFPESGDCVVGLPCRIYVEAASPISGDPVDIEGDVVVKPTHGKYQGTRLATLRTTHEGRGVSEYFVTPAEGTTWFMLHAMSVND